MSAYPPIEAVLPHRPPMILLDRIEGRGDETITCSVRIHDESPFVLDGSVPAIVATEYMAQCVAAYAGLMELERGDPIVVGYLVGVRRAELKIARFEVGNVLTVKVRQVWGDLSLGQFDCSVELSGLRVASALLNVFQGDPDSHKTAIQGQE